jgi:hypothetical protein
MAEVDEAVAVCFVVRIDDESLGSFNSCDGLGIEFTVEQREEGGNNGMVWQLPTRKTAIIEARTLDGTVVASWALSGVVPVRWSGPQLSADSPKVATETLELAHHGFLSTAK